MSTAPWASDTAEADRQLFEPHPHSPHLAAPAAAAAHAAATSALAAGSPMKELFSFGFLAYDNLTFADVEARADYGAATLEAVGELIGATAAAEEACSRALLEAATAAPTAASIARGGRGTGQGISPLVDGCAPRQASLLGQSLQAIGSSLGGMGFGSLFAGSSTAAATAATNAAAAAAASSASAGSGDWPGSPQSGGGTAVSAHAVGNGPSSLGLAVEALFRATARQAGQRQQLAQQLRRLHRSLAALREQQQGHAAALLGRARESARAVEAISRELERAHQRVRTSRRELLDAEERFLSARGSAGAVPEHELQRRQSRLTQAKADVEASERSVIRASEDLVAQRRRRDDDLTVTARQLQRADKERMAALARALGEVTNCALEAAGAAQVASLGLADAIASVGVESDMRMFTYHRRLALMLQEQTALQDARAGRLGALPSSASLGNLAGAQPPQAPGGGGSGGDRNNPFGPSSGGASGASGSGGSNSIGSGVVGGVSELNFVPQPHPVAVSMRHNRDFIQAEKVLSPVCARWVAALFAGTGHEVLHGSVVAPRLPKVHHSGAAGSSGTEGSSSSRSGGGGGGTHLTDTSAGLPPPALASSPAPASLPDHEGAEGVSAGAAVGAEVDTAAGAGVAPAAGASAAADAGAEADADADAADGEGFDIEMLDNHAARIAFLRSLNQQRSKRQDAGAGFGRLARVVWWLLDACEAHEDVCCARMVSVMAETFFEVLPPEEPSQRPLTAAAPGGPQAHQLAQQQARGGPRRFFLQTLLRRHSLWAHEAFWEEVFYQSLYDAVRATSNPYSHGAGRLTPLGGEGDGGGDEGGGGGGGGGGGEEPRSPAPAASGERDTAAASMPSYRPGSADWGYAYTQTLFSQLAAVAMNMITFGVPPERVVRSVTSLARGNGLPLDMTYALHDTVRTYSGQL